MGIRSGAFEVLLACIAHASEEKSGAKKFH